MLIMVIFVTYFSAGRPRGYQKGAWMPKDFYTLLILPRKHSSAKKISLSSSLVTGSSIVMMALILFVMYISYDYIHIRREKDELVRLKYQTQEQRKEIEGLAGQIGRAHV